MRKILIIALFSTACFSKNLPNLEFFTHSKRNKDFNFLRPISHQITQYWQKIVLPNRGLKASVIIKIDNQGRFTYRNVKLTKNKFFNNKLIRMLKYLEIIKWQPYKYGKYVEVELEFSDKK